MDYSKVIYLGHKAELPLIRLPSELSDGLEPHDSIYSPYMTRAAAVQCGSGVLAAGVYPGWWQAGWVPGRGIPGTCPAGSTLRLI